MSPDQIDKAGLIKYRLEQAQDTLRDAYSLYKIEGTPVSIVNRAYYAMFYAALAVLITIDRGSSKHMGVISIFDEQFVRQNIFPKEMSRMLHQAFEMRQEGDYRDASKITIEKAIKVLKSADEFIALVEEKLNDYYEK
jgi:uncharacterized protein (UPF0332 family)